MATLADGVRCDMAMLLCEGRVCIYIYTHTHSQKHTYIHTYMHTYIHIHMLSCTYISHPYTHSHTHTNTHSDDVRCDMAMNSTMVFLWCSGGVSIVLQWCSHERRRP